MGKGRAVRFGVRVLAAALLGAACSPSTTTEAPRTGADIVIGVPNAATGAYNVEGPLTKQGYDLWQEWANNQGGIEVQGVRHKVRLIYQDDQSTPQLSAQIAERMLTDDKVQFLLSPYGSAPSAAVAAAAEKHRIPLVASNAG